MLVLAACSTWAPAEPPADGAPDLETERQPLAADDGAYTCGWPTDDPGDLAGTGTEAGDTVHELLLWDQCVEPFSVWDLHGRYVLLYLTPTWCVPCGDVARTLSVETGTIRDRLGVELVPVVVVYEDQTGGPPGRFGGAVYASELGLTGFPVTADPDALSTTLLPFTGSALPGRCVLSPDSTILGCVEGDASDGQIEQWIRADAALD